MDETLINSILKKQYKLVSNTDMTIQIRTKVYKVEDVIVMLMKTIESLNLEVDTISKMFGLSVEEAIE